MIKLRACEGTSCKAEKETQEAGGEADGQSDIVVCDMHQNTIDDELSDHFKAFPPPVFNLLSRVSQS